MPSRLAARLNKSNQPECLICKTRLAMLEKASIAHEAELVDHSASLTALKAKLESLSVSNKRIEELLERVLKFVTPSAQ
jgi:hypothetical protein